MSKGQEWKVSAEESGLRLDKWLAAPGKLGSRSRALDAIAKGKVFIADVEQTTTGAARKLQPGEVVRVWMDRPGSAERRYTDRREAGVHILYEDASLLVINKPPGLLTVPLPAHPDEPSLLDQLQRHLRSDRKRQPLVVHRIDRDTSGLVLFAKTHEAQQNLKAQFERREAERIYLAVVYGCPRPDSGTWRDHLVWDEKALKQHRAERRDPRAKEAICHYRVLEKLDGASLIEVRLVTGKRNQIRIQAGLRGHTLVGEKKYVYDTASPRNIEFSRQALHSSRLGFIHPLHQRPLKFEAPLPEDLQLLLKRRNKP